MFVVGFYALQLQRALSAKPKIGAARTSALSRLEDKTSQAVQALKQKGLVAAPIASAVADVCFVTHQDIGFTIAGWYQDCYVRSVQGFQTAATHQQALQAITSQQSYFGKADATDYLQSVNACQLSEDDNREFVRYRPAGSRASDYDCGIPDQLQGTFSVNGPIISDKDLSAKKFSSFNPSAIGSSTNQLWVIFDVDYYHEDLGCAPTVLCGNPRPSPAQAP